MTLDRRNFIKLLGSASGLAIAGCATGPGVSSGSAAEIMPKTTRRVVVVGGGYGGTIAAKYIRMMDKSIEVVLVEKNDHFVSCPFSNLYIGGILPDLSPLTIKYDKLVANHGIKFVQANVTAIDPAAHTVVTDKGTLKYDRLVMSPGIDFRTEEIEGYDAKSTPELMPHAWKAGPQSVLLRKQLEAMHDGGTVVLSVPLSPFRCPPGPYERTSMIAHYLKAHKPKSKIIVVDANPDIASKGPLFRKGWDMHYKGLIDYRKASKVTAIGNKSVLIEGLDEVKGDVINLIPPQRAAKIAQQAGLVGEDKKWCPIVADTFESTLQKDIHVIGDSSIAGAMPKSGYSANSEAKVCATNVVNLMNSRSVMPMSGINTCYSYLSADEAISVAAVYASKDGKIISVPNSGGVSPADWSMAKTEAIYAKSWLNNILTEMSS
jgi:sulfide dehydrogenase [flavocytochrome c] flavoprotein subunit